MDKSKEPDILVGYITGAHGIKGEVKVEPLTEKQELRFAKDTSLWSDKLSKYVLVEAARQHKEVLLVKLADINDRTTAETLIGSYLRVSEDELPPLPEGQYYHFEIIGLKVWEKERFIGTVGDIIQAGGSDVYSIERENQQDLLLPALKSIVKKINLIECIMQVELPPGLED